uniref:Uncharacterized protein n=1 Tax=Oryza brachyantha TaxID=4533 RepID=J3LFT9_ORYBR
MANRRPTWQAGASAGCPAPVTHTGARPAIRRRSDAAVGIDSATLIKQTVEQQQQQHQRYGTSSPTTDDAAAHPPPMEGGVGNDDFMDEEAIFELPQLLRNMAAGMMMSPPRLSPTTSDVSPEPSEAGESLWSYRDP